MKRYPQLLFLSLLTFICATGQRQTPIFLSAENGKIVLVSEVSSGREYWLQPSCELESVRTCSTCVEKNALILTVRFWRRSTLTEVRELLRRDGLCKPEQPCRVFPHQARRIAVRDSRGHWQASAPWFAVSGYLPKTKEVSVRPATSASESPSSTLTKEALDSFEVVVSFTSTDTTTAIKKKRLSITGEEVLWAQRLFKIPIGSKQLIDSASLRKLASWLLSAKKRQIETGPPSSPYLLEKIERSLTLAAVTFRSSLQQLIPKGYRFRSGQRLFVLRSLGPKEQLIVPLNQDASYMYDSMTLELKVAKKLKLYTIPKNVSNDAAVELLLGLEGKLTALSKAFTTQMMNLQVSNISTLNQSLHSLDRKFEKLATLVGASHLTSEENIDLKSVDDCNEVKSRRWKGGMYFLRSMQRSVLCSNDGDLVVLHRSSGDANFNASWTEYERGIGQIGKTDFFIGLEALSALTQKADVCMTLLMQPLKANEGEKRAEYDSFRVGPKNDQYRLAYSDYKGNLVFDGMSVMNNMRFTTHDSDHDVYLGNCARRFASGNWFNSCFQINVFGPMRNDFDSGLCGKGLLRSQGEMCSAISQVRMLLKKKTSNGGSLKIVFSTIASNSGCSAKIKTFSVPASGQYRVTVGGATGGRHTDFKNNGPGGRGAKVQADYYFHKGTILAAAAGCRGLPGSRAANGGDASWIVSRTKQVLLAAAGGGGGSSYSNENHYLPGLPGRATPDGGDAWFWQNEPSGSAKSILMREGFGTRAKGWPDLRQRLLSGSGDFSSGGKAGDCYGGGGGGGFEGGAGCPTYGYYDGGGGGGSFCNSTEAAACSITEAGNTRPGGYIILERRLCF